MHANLSLTPVRYAFLVFNINHKEKDYENQEEIKGRKPVPRTGFDYDGYPRMHVSAGMVGVMIETAKAFWLFLVKLWFRCFYMGLGGAAMLLVLAYAPNTVGIKAVSVGQVCAADDLFIRPLKLEE